MKIVYKIFCTVIATVRRAFSAYMNYCCRKAKKKSKINYFWEAHMRADISIAKTELEAKVLGYTHEEWVEYQKSIQPKVEAVETKEGDGNV